MDEDHWSISLAIRDSQHHESTHVITLPVRDSQITSVVRIGESSVDADNPNEFSLSSPRKLCTALWDTGAISTVVEPHVIDSLGIEPIGYEESFGIEGVVTTRPKYKLTIILAKEPIAAFSDDTLVSLHEVSALKLEEDGQLGENIDILIGMDIIQRGDFAVTQDSSGDVWFSFRHPARQVRIDFDGAH